MSDSICFHWKTVIFAVRPRFRVKPQNTTAHEGTSVMLHCAAAGDPPPAIHWDKNGRPEAIDRLRFKASDHSIFT